MLKLWIKFEQLKREQSWSLFWFLNCYFLFFKNRIPIIQSDQWELELYSNENEMHEMSVTSFLFWPIKLAFVVDKWMRVIKEKAKGYASEKVVLFCNSAHWISSWCSWLKFRLSFVSVSSKNLLSRPTLGRVHSSGRDQEQAGKRAGSSLTSLTHTYWISWESSNWISAWIWSQILFLANT